MRKLPNSEKPYRDIRRARIGNKREVPVEVILKGQAVAKKNIVADGAMQLHFDTPIEKIIGSHCASCSRHTQSDLRYRH
jgi:hypothetical protein